MDRRAAYCLALSALLTLHAHPVGAQDADPWFAPDKAMHLGASSTLAVTGYALGSLWTDHPTPRWLLGAGLSVGLGTTKSLWDVADHGETSGRDYVWNLVGTVTGLALAWAVDTLLTPHAPSPTPALSP